jgi:hypothetical protein
MAEWKRSRRLAFWLTTFMGRWALIVAGISLVAGFAVVATIATIIDHSHCFEDDDSTCQAAAYAAESVSIGTANVVLGFILACLLCGLGYLAHRIRQRLATVVNAPRLQGWKNWVVDGAITTDEYHKAAPVLTAWMEGTSPNQVQRLGAMYLRRVGYATAAAALFLPLSRSPNKAVLDGFDMAATAATALLPLTLGAAILCIIGGIALGVQARRNGHAERRAFDELEHHVLLRRAKPNKRSAA